MGGEAQGIRLYSPYSTPYKVCSRQPDRHECVLPRLQWLKQFLSSLCMMVTRHTFKKISSPFSKSFFGKIQWSKIASIITTAGKLPCWKLLPYCDELLEALFIQLQENVIPFEEIFGFSSLKSVFTLLSHWNPVPGSSESTADKSVWVPAIWLPSPRHC